MPAHISEPCKQLIKSILQVNPVQRITISEIKEHPWFLKFSIENSVQPLPPPKATLDPSVMAELERKLQLSPHAIRHQVLKAEETGVSNICSIAYQLMADHLHVNPEIAKPVPTRHTKLQDTAIMLAASPPINLRGEVTFSDERDIMQDSLQKALVNNTQGAPLNEGPRKLWNLGLMTKSTPNVVIKEVLTALTKYEFEWKLLGPYTLRCRKMGYEELLDEEKVKIGIQLFSFQKKQKGKNVATLLLDVKLIEGATFNFFKVCGQILNELKHLPQQQDIINSPPLGRVPEKTNFSDTWIQ